MRLESEKLIKYLELDVIEAEQDIIIGCQSIVRLYSKVFVEHIQQLVKKANALDNAPHLLPPTVTNISETPADYEELVEGTAYNPWLSPPQDIPEESELPAVPAFPETADPSDTAFHKRTEEFVNGVERTLPKDHETRCPGMLKLLLSEKYRRCFVWRKWRHIKIDPIELTWSEDMPAGHTIPPRACPAPKREAATRQVQKYVEQGFLKAADVANPYTSPTVIVWKAPPQEKDVRVAIDFTWINRYLVPIKHTAPMLTLEVEKLTEFTEFLDIDLKEAFHGLPVARADQIKLGVATHMGTYTPTAIPEGVTPGSGLLQKVVNRIFEPILYRATCMQDNLLVGIAAHEDPVDIARMVLDICLEHDVSLSWVKSKWAISTVDFWGYRIHRGTMGMSPERKQAIVDYPKPTNTKEAQRFLGLANFFGPYIPHYRTKVEPLFAWLTARHNFAQEDQLGIVFENILKSMADAMQTFFPRRDVGPWTLRTDASGIGWGAILLQRVPRAKLTADQAEALEPDADYQLQPIALVSGAFSPAARKNWHAHTAELYGIYAALKKLRNLIDNVALVVETDHCNLLQAQTNHSALARRWIHWIRAEFNILHIVHRRGIRNALADACSRAFDIAAHDAKLLMGVKGPVQAVLDISESSNSKAKPPAQLAAIAILARRGAYSRELHSGRGTRAQTRTGHNSEPDRHRHGAHLSHGNRGRGTISHTTLPLVTRTTEGFRQRA